MTTKNTTVLELPEEALLYAYDVYPDGTAKSLRRTGLSAEVPESVSYRWIHLNLASPQIIPWITDQVDELVATSLTLDDTRPRCTEHKRGMLINLRGVNLNPDSDPEDMVSIRLWVTEHLVVSVRMRRLMAVVELRQSIDNDMAPQTTAAFLTRLAAKLTAKMDPVITSLSDSVDTLEDNSLDQNNLQRSDLAALRRKAIILKRFIAPQRDALSTLGFTGSPIIDELFYVPLRESVDRVTRMLEELDAVRERCAILNDQLTDRRAEEMNSRLMVLSVVTAIFLPLGFLTGLFGINIGGMPGTNNNAAFWIFAGILIILAVGLLWWFRRKKWF